MRDEKLNGYFWVEKEDKSGNIVKADTMCEAIKKMVGNFAMTEISSEEDYCSYVVCYPANAIIPEKTEIIRARTILVKN